MPYERTSTQAEEFQAQMLARNIFRITMIGAVVFVAVSASVLFGSAH